MKKNSNGAPASAGKARLKPGLHSKLKVIILAAGLGTRMKSQTVKALLDEHKRSGNALTLLTMKLDDAALYGRIVRDANGGVTRIVEAKDANEEQRKIREVNAGIYVFEGQNLAENLRRLSTNNAQGEYYLTDLIGMLRESGKRVGALVVDDPIEVLGV